LTNSIGMKLMPIAIGEFDMGTEASYTLTAGYERSLGPERPQHHVKMTHPYYLGAHEVTVAQFRQFAEATHYQTTAEKTGKGSHIFSSQGGFEFRKELNWKTPGIEQGDDHPVVQVSWDDAVAFCNWLSEKEKVVYRLPTEAEWEYACRAGTTSPWSFGSFNSFARSANVADVRVLQKYGQYGVAALWDDGHLFSAPVGSYLPNPFGLYDMHGNVWEWCADWYDPVYYSYSESADPTGPRKGKMRVQRSGSFLHHHDDLRSNHRDGGEPDQTQSHLGFRVAREMK
jgi:formylglycine-generating enzyme required for sulfatase activity